MVAWLANEPLCTRHCSGPTAYGWAARRRDRRLGGHPGVADALPALAFARPHDVGERRGVADALEHGQVGAEAGDQRVG